MYSKEGADKAYKDSRAHYIKKFGAQLSGTCQ